MGKAEVVTLNRAVAKCPECESIEWLIQLDGFERDFTHVIAHECAKCGWRLEINVEIINYEDWDAYKRQIEVKE